MRLMLLAGLLTASTCLAQTPAPGPLAQNQTSADATKRDGEITIPAGTRVPVTLSSPIHLKAVRKGDTVRVATAFPVTVGTQLAIPAGTYLEGVIDKIQKHVRAGDAHLQLHFTRMVYANGYEVALTDASATAKNSDSDERLPGQEMRSYPGVMSNSLMPQQAPTPPPLPQVGPSKGTVIGVAVGVAAAVTVVGILLAHHSGGGSDTVIDAGTQFDLIFQAPITVDEARMASVPSGSAP